MSNFRHSVFMSYAHDDDIAWANFITHFDTELNRGLESRLRELSPPRTHLSSKNGPIHGPLDDALRQAIEASFAMIVFVHDGYLRSTWCLQELAYFRQLHGEDGFLNRLFIVAMSRRAIERLSKRLEWIDLFPKPDPVWMPFYGEELPNQPIEMFLSFSRGTEAVMSNKFLQQFFKLRERMVELVQDAADLDPALFAPADAPRTQPPAALDALEVLTYIESEPGQEGFWEPLGNQVAQAWDRAVALEPKEPKLLLRHTGLPMHDLQNRPRLDNADGVILLWGEKAQESLLAQIAMVEPKLSGPNLTPGLIAYMMEVGTESRVAVPEMMQKWPVVRFATRRGEQGSATVVGGDEAKLQQYLLDVLGHKRKALASNKPSA